MLKNTRGKTFANYHQKLQNVIEIYPKLQNS